MKYQKHSSLARTGIFAILSGVSLGLAACAVEPLDMGESEVRGSEQELIGGLPVPLDFYRSTVGIGDVCTAAKVGPRLFLTAAHCVAGWRVPPRYPFPLPEDYPENNGIAGNFLPGNPLVIHSGVNTGTPEDITVTIVQTHIHPSWWSCPTCYEPVYQEGTAADIAVIEIAEDTPQIPSARVDLDPVPVGTEIIKVGYGCEVRTNIPVEELDGLGRYKSAEGTTIPASSIVHPHEVMHRPAVTSSQAALIGDTYLITAGHAQNPDNASLCMGDSGGPLYLKSSAEPRIVGVNSDYTFMPRSGSEDLGGVSWTDLHTRTSLGSLHNVGSWLQSLNVDTVGGSANTNCTCPSGCNAVKTVSAPLFKQGVDDSCYFLPDLGYSLNNYSMIQVNLNGQDVTNQWVGNWAYPARKDGGYYVYVKAGLSWAAWQVVN